MGGGVALLSGGHVANGGTIEGGDYGNVGYEVGGSCGAGAAGIAPLTGTLVNHGAVLGGSGGHGDQSYYVGGSGGCAPCIIEPFQGGNACPAGIAGTLIIGPSLAPTSHSLGGHARHGLRMRGDP